MTKNVTIPRYYWDACVFLSYIEGVDGRVDTIYLLLEEAAKGEIEIYTSSLSIVEVAYAKMEKDGRTLDDEVENKIDGLWVPASPIKLIEFHPGIALIARTIIRRCIAEGRRCLKPADAIHAATAKSQKIKTFHTYNTVDFKPHESALELSVERPVSHNLFAS